MPAAEDPRREITRGALSLARTQPMTLVAILLLAGAGYAGHRVLAHLDRSDEAMAATARAIERMTAEQGVGRAETVRAVVSEVSRCCPVSMRR